ncbi:ABC transporter substrate-binding protein [Nocardioides sp. TRM66260-LWL]|uniref:ABC transporter substrate-binding protein n=1 Tax=Nocardioides sp. TRM66260-LWL TaxID=2874478 RepID=UPI001CC7D533|nr:ABC transporter substrate-binding protein [Nocardioides sp. TRM66260-LWL]MBZ5735756.1 ABC transporter substrate-binding protein [Nocardioides sp. TRM66260-LWL]
MSRTPRPRLVRRALLGATLAGALALTACGGSDSGSDSPFSSGSNDAGSITIGSANFPENELLMNIYAGALEAKGVKVETKPNIGSREIYLKAFEDGDIDLLPEYSGALLAYLSGKAGPPKDATSPEQVYDALQKVLPDGAQTLTQAAAEDKDTLTVTADTAKKYSLSSIEDLAPVAGQLTLGGPPEFRERQQGLVGLKSEYGLTFKSFKPLDAGGPLVISALKKGDVDVANVFSTDPTIATEGWVSLTDPKNLFSAQNIVPLIKKDAVTPQVTEALNAVSTALTTEKLTALMAKIVTDKQDPKTVAKDFLSENGLG